MCASESVLKFLLNCGEGDIIIPVVSYRNKLFGIDVIGIGTQRRRR